jgi:hypothetical protein
MHENINSDHEPMRLILSELIRIILDFVKKLGKAIFDLGDIFLESHYWQESLGTDLADEIGATLCICFGQADEFMHALLS